MKSQSEYNQPINDERGSSGWTFVKSTENGWTRKTVNGRGKKRRKEGERERGRRGGPDRKRSQEDCRNPERICQLLLALILMEASAPLPLTHLALIPALLSKLFKL